MSDLPQPTPAQLADYDQAHAEAAETLGWLIHRHRVAVQIPHRELAVSALAWEFHEDWSLEDLVSLLALAVDRLTTSSRP